MKLSRRKGRRVRREQKRKQKKQKFLAELSSHNSLLDLDVLYKSGRLCSNGVRWKASTQKYIYDNLLFAYQTKIKLLNGRKVHEGFVVFDIIERGKVREAYSIHIRERVVQRVLSDYILMPFILKTIVDRNCASIKGKGEIYAEGALKNDLRAYYKRYKNNNGFVVKLDVSKYFERINRSKIKELLSEIPDEIIQNLVKEFADSYEVFGKFKDGTGMGLGSQFVQISGIVSLTDHDHYIKECMIDGDLSSRYMDDTYILSTPNDAAEKLLNGMCKSEKLGFLQNKEKCFYAPINRPFIWLKKLYCLSDTGKVTVRIGQKTATRERKAIKNRKEWVDKGKITYHSYMNQARSWLINVRKHYDSKFTCLGIEKTFQWCFYNLLNDNIAPAIKRINNIRSAIKKENVVLLIHVCTLYITYDMDAVVLSEVLQKPIKSPRYINENNLYKVLHKLNLCDVSYIVIDIKEDDTLKINANLKEINSYGYYTKP